MHRWTPTLAVAVAAVCWLCVLAGATGAVAGSASSTGPGPGDDVRIDGSVTGVDGDPAGDAVVLVGDTGDLRERSTSELRALAASDPAGVTVVEVDGDGEFATTVSWGRADAAVAVSDDGISEIVSLGHENTTVEFRLSERRPQTVFAHLGAVAHDQRRAELYLSLIDTDDTPIENLSVRVTALPEGWSVATVDTDGRYDPWNRTVRWSSVDPGEEVDTTVVLLAPANATPGEYHVGLAADSTSHPVSIESETVEVLPEETPGPTTMPPRTDPTTSATATSDGGPTGTDRPTGTTFTDDPEVTVDGFGPLAPAIALAGVTALFLRRRR